MTVFDTIPRKLRIAQSTIIEGLARFIRCWTLTRKVVSPLPKAERATAIQTPPFRRKGRPERQLKREKIRYSAGPADAEACAVPASAPRHT